MTTPKIEVGSLVRLNSGGPKMAVTDANEDLVWCVWMDTTDTAQTGIFPRPCIHAVQDMTIINPDGSVETLVAPVR